MLVTVALAQVSEKPNVNWRVVALVALAFAIYGCGEAFALGLGLGLAGSIGYVQHRFPVPACSSSNLGK